MKAQKTQPEPDPKQKGQQDTSRPKDPNNDPDQTPNREVKNPPQAPGKTGGPNQNQDSPAYK